MSATIYFQAMARNNAWANERLLTACEQLSDAEFVAQRVGFFPSLMLTLNHILVVDWFYVDALEGGTLGPDAWSDPAPCQTARTLRAAQQTVDQRLIDFCNDLSEASLGNMAQMHRGARIQIERVDRVLLHLFQHQVHHRGQAHAMLSATQIRPPQLDEFFVAEDAPLRVDEFRRLGWSEEEVWQQFPAPAVGN
ncbi:MAG TPA: DinB family protein [Dongiaceae bacterium]|nr:DinB family protein [Dongiaceae bacterium]